MDQVIDYTLIIENNILLRVEPVYKCMFEDFLFSEEDFLASKDEFEFFEDEEENGEKDTQNAGESTNTLNSDNLYEIEVDLGLDVDWEAEEDERDWEYDEARIDTNAVDGEVKNLEEIIVPEGITQISTRAFWACKDVVKKVQLPESLTEIEDEAFYGCVHLESIELPEYMICIGQSAFADCISLKEIKIPCGVKKLETRLFTDCKNLERVIIPEGVEEIEDFVFWGCNKLHALDLPKSLKRIGRYFLVGAGFEGIVVPEGVSQIHHENFREVKETLWVKTENGESDYIEKIDWLKIAEGNPFYCMKNDMLFTADGKKVLYCPANIKGKVIIPEGVISIGNDAFYKCKDIEEIILPDSVKELGSYAFYGCSKLRRLILPAQIKTLSEGVFMECEKLEDIYIHENISYIGSSAFWGCISLQNLMIPSSVQIIGKEAFSNCLGLKQAELLEGVKKIGKEAFSNCKRLYEIRIPDSVELIEEEAFDECKKLTITCYGDSEAERYAFENEIPRNYYCLELSDEEYFEWDEYVATYEEGKENPFCQVIDGIVYSKDGTILIRCSEDYQGTVIVADGVTAIQKEAFYQCEQVEKVILPEGLLYIGHFAFYECCSLKEVTFPESLIAIEKSAFAYCKKLQKIYLGNEVRVLGEYAFEETGLREITIPKTLTSDCGKYVFSGCKNLSLVRMPQFFDGMALETCFDFFEGCEALERIIIEENGKECEWEDEGEYYTIDGLVFCKRGKSLAFCPLGRKGVLFIPEGIEGSYRAAFSRECKITKVVFPASWKENLISQKKYGDSYASEILYTLSELEFVEVSKANKYYISEQGLLFTKDGKRLLYCPKKMQGVVKIPEGVEDASKYAFDDCSLITEIHYPKTYQHLDGYEGCDSLKEIKVFGNIRFLGRDIKEWLQHGIFPNLNIGNYKISIIEEETK